MRDERPRAFHATFIQSVYGGVQDVRMRPDDIWMPDILLFESSSASFDPTYPSNIIVNKGCRRTGDSENISTCASGGGGSTKINPKLLVNDRQRIFLYLQIICKTDMQIICYLQMMSHEIICRYAYSSADLPQSADIYWLALQIKFADVQGD